MTTVDPELQQDRAIARRLPRAWPAFFEIFGRLTPVQREGIPVILEGKDALVISATASGKTEAACAPLIERHMGSDEPWTILYISPTRALVNDLYARLWQPLHRLSLSVKRRTGDHRERPGGAHVLLTTPESFDSLLCRGRTDGGVGHSLAHVVALVLDEVHLLHGTARGEQVAWLIERLRRLRREARERQWARRENFQVVALSATVPDPEGILARYFPGGTTVRLLGGRSIETIAPPGSSLDVEEALPDYLRSATRPEKVLVFSNARRRVDDLAARLRNPLEGLGYTARAHHGSLDRREREATEDAIKNNSKIVVFSTSTLELGIDIGDIDLVVLDGPAPDIRSLLQRIGRGNRRTDITRVMTCAGSVLEVVVHDAMIQAAREGWLGSPEHGPQHAVARQQAVSYIFQSPRRSRSRAGVQALLDKCAAEVVSRTLLDEMLLAEEVLEDESGLRSGDDWLRKAANGQIHSNIEEPPGVEVIDEQTGRRIASGLRFQKGKGLRAGGLLLEARRWNERKLEVRQVKDAGLAQGEWGYISRAWCRGPDQTSALKRYLGVAENVWPLARMNGQRHVFHFGGAKRKAILQLAADAARPPAEISVNEWYLTLDGAGVDKPRWIQDPGGWEIEVAVTSKLNSLEHVLGRPMANRRLPLDARVHEVKEWLHIEEELDCLKTCIWTSDIDEDLALILNGLVSAVRNG